MRSTVVIPYSTSWDAILMPCTSASGSLGPGGDAADAVGVGARAERQLDDDVGDRLGGQPSRRAYCRSTAFELHSPSAQSIA